MRWYEPSARYSRMIVRVPSACVWRSSVYASVASFSASTAASSRQTNRYGASGSLGSVPAPPARAHAASHPGPVPARPPRPARPGPSGLVEQVGGLLEQRDPLRNRRTARTTRCRTTWITASRSMARRSPAGRDTPGSAVSSCRAAAARVRYSCSSRRNRSISPGRARVDHLHRGEPAAAVRAIGEPDSLRLGVHLEPRAGRVRPERRART
jgi:hypothetical protein